MPKNSTNLKLKIKSFFSKDYFQDIKPVKDKIDFYENLIKPDQPFELVLLLSITYINLWISSGYQPDFINIILITSVVISSYCFLVMFTYLIGFLVNKYSKYQIPNIRNLKINQVKPYYFSGIAILFLILIILSLLIYSLVLNYYLAITALILYLLFLALKCYKFFGPIQERKYHTMIVDIGSHLLIALLYSGAGLFAFITIYGKFASIGLQLWVINLFGFLAYAIFKNVQKKTDLAKTIDVFLSMFCLLVFIVGIFWIYHHLIEDSFVLPKLLIGGLYCYILYRIFDFNKLKQSDQINRYYQIILRIMTVIPLVFWLILIKFD